MQRSDDPVCQGEGVVLQVRGNRHHGHRRQGPPGTPEPPSEEPHGLSCLKHTRVQQIVRPPAKQPDTQMVAAKSVSIF